jgi:hypothetical protein
MTKPIKLTVEQAALAPAFREKWQSVAKSTKPINKPICRELSKHLYRELGQGEPEILFFDSPYAALKDKGEFIENNRTLSQNLLAYEHKITGQIHSDIQLSLGSWNMLESLRNIEDIGQWMGVNYAIFKPLRANFRKLSDPTCYEWFRPSENIANSRCQEDFLLSLFNCDSVKASWETLKNLDERMGWYRLLPEICIVCDRPSRMKFDEQRKIHMNAAPAIEYADGFSLYAFHGTILPQRYGQVSSDEWEPQWLLEKNSDEIRRALIKGMSFEKISGSLNLNKIDTCKNYILWSVENKTKGKPIVLLTCETSQKIIVNSVAPRLKSIRKAIEFLNTRHCQEDVFSGD